MGNFESFYGKPVGSSAGSLSGVGRFTKLWENPSPTSAFAAQNITLDSDDYDFLLTIFKYDTSWDGEKSAIVPKGKNIMCDFVDNTTAKHTYYRYCVPTTNTSLSWSVGYIDGTSANQYVIPLAIYGIKLL